MRVAGAVAFGRYRKAPIYWHWTLLVGAVIFTAFNYSPGRVAAFPLIVLFHEIGHAVLVRRYRLRVHALVIHGVGGECIHDGGSKLQRSVIAWGGVIGQAVLLAPALAATTFHLLPAGSFAADLARNLVIPNLLMAAYNLMPVGTLDGVRAWQYWKLRKQKALVPATRRARDLALHLNDVDRRAMPRELQAEVAALLVTVRRPPPGS